MTRRSPNSVRTTRRALLGGVAGSAALSVLSPGLRGAAQTPQAQPVVEDVGLAVFPQHGTRTAPPGAEISFRGESIESIGVVEVTGSQSGSHTGVLVHHSDGMGASFVPDAPFQPDEWVTIRAGVPLRPTPSGSVTFRIAIPGMPVKTPTERELDQPAHEPQTFKSRLDLLPPTIDVTDTSTEVAPGLVFVGAKVGDGQAGAMIVDNHGDLVWFRPLALDVAVDSDVRAQVYRGEPVLTMWQGISSDLGTGFGHFIILNHQYQEIARIQVANGYHGFDQHECYITDNDTLLAIVYNPVQWDMSAVGGPADGAVLDGVVQEIDIATGRMIFEWHALDHIALEEAYGEYTEEEPWDYIHINSVGPDGDDFVLSARHTNAAYKIERATGRVLWRLHGKQSSFEMEPGSEFFYNHDARVHADGTLSLFDNHESDQDLGDEAWSRGLVFDLDEREKTATVVREYIHPTEILSVSQGNMQMLPNGNAFVGWGSAPVFSEFDAEGNLLFNGRFPQGTNSYRAFRCEWEGRPSSPPDVAVETGLGDDVTVYVSWNGATEVDSWIVLAGPDANSLEEVTTSLRNGFETTIETQTPGPFVTVQARDAEGNSLGIPAAIQIR